MSIYENGGEIIEILISTIDNAIEDLDEGQIGASIGDLVGLTRSIAPTREGEEKRELYFLFLQFNTMASVYSTAIHRLRTKKKEARDSKEDVNEIEESINELNTNMRQIAKDILSKVKKGIEEEDKDKVIEAFERASSRLAGEIFKRYFRGE